MENWGNRLKEIREKHGLSQYELGAKVGKDITQISRYEKGKASRKRISRRFKELLGGVFSDQEIAYIETGEVQDQGEAPAVVSQDAGESAAAKIPVLSETASAGGGSNIEGVDSYESGRTLSIDRELFGNVDPAKVRAVEVEGYSMVPVLLPGSWVFFREGREWSGDGLYVLIFRGVLMVKQVAADPKTGNLWIKSANRDYESWEYDPTEDQSTMRIVGRVVRVMM